MKTSLKSVREQLNMTQVEAAKFLGVSRRTYQNYETDNAYENTIKYEYMLEKLTNFLEDESKGILSLEEIKKKSEVVFSKYDISYCYLFGSYAKGKAREDSDVDLLIATDITGLRFFGLVEELRNALKKKVDALELRQLVDNKELLNEVLKYGIKIYG